MARLWCPLWAVWWPEELQEREQLPVKPIPEPHPSIPLLQISSGGGDGGLWRRILVSNWGGCGIPSPGMVAAYLFHYYALPSLLSKKDLCHDGNSKNIQVRLQKNPRFVPVTNVTITETNDHNRETRCERRRVSDLWTTSKRAWKFISLGDSENKSGCL